MAKHTKTRTIQRTCPTCGESFVTGSSIKAYCSPECRVIAVSSSFVGQDGCWPWPGSRNPATGYGQLSDWRDGRRVLLTAHRVAFRAFYGMEADGKVVCHACDNRSCFNPAHLFLGSQNDNVQDCVAKGRQGKRITPEIAARIKASTESGVATARQFGVSQSLVSAIRRGHVWSTI